MNQSKEPLPHLTWRQFLRRILPFADVATADLPLSRLLRLSLFQISVGMAMVLLTGTLNRVMVVELHVPTWLVATMVALPLVFAPFRALIGHRSDYHRSAFGLRRIPYLWIGSLLQFGGFAIMPFALLLLADAENSLNLMGKVSAAVAFLLVGAGLHTTQTAGLALATDLVPAEKRPRVVALLYVTLLVGMLVSALLFGKLLTHFTPQLLIQLIQGAAAATLILNMIALWRQEAIDRERAAAPPIRPPFLATWREFAQGGRASQLLLVVGLGTAGFTMQDILLEPYGGQVLGMSVAQTTALTALLAGGTLLAFALAAHQLGRGANTYRLAAGGVVIGLIAFSAVISAALLDSTLLFRVGTGLIGFGAGLFAVSTLIAAMELAEGGHSGLALGAWGAVQATANGVAVALGGGLRDLVTALVPDNWGTLTERLVIGYSAVYVIELLLLLGTLIVLRPLLRQHLSTVSRPAVMGLEQMP